SLTNTLATILGGETASSSLSVSSAGAITQTGALNVGGASSFATTAGNADLTLGNAGNVLSGVITLNPNGSGNASLTNATPPQLPGTSIGGTLSVTSTGAISETGPLSVTGASSFNAGASTITLTAANAFTGSVSLTTTSDAALTNTGAT